MQVDDNLLQKLEKLSYLRISDEKRDEVIEQLSEIVNFVDNLSQLDTQSVSSTFSMNEEATFLREDIPFCDTNINDSILNNAPQSRDHFFVVPKIIE